jgi:membrane fusion protein (multidrug efflux system)
VTLGEKLGDQQVVLSGLNGGEFIAGEGAFKLREGILVYTAPFDEQLATTDDKTGGQ